MAGFYANIHKKTEIDKLFLFTFYKKNLNYSFEQYL